MSLTRERWRELKAQGIDPLAKLDDIEEPAHKRKKSGWHPPTTDPNVYTIRIEMEPVYYCSKCKVRMNLDTPVLWPARCNNGHLNSPSGGASK